MPTYEYACKFCGHHLEVYQPITAAALTRCPKCKKAGLKRLISGGAGIIFKGTGFYETDYKRAPASAEKKTEASKSAPKSDTSKPAVTKSEPAKPAAKPAKI